MAEEAKNSEQEKLEQLIQENVKLTREIHQMSKRVNRYVTFQNILSVVYLFLVVAPLILGVIYLPYFMKNIVTPYQNILNANSNLQNAAGNANPQINDVVNQVQRILNENNKK